MRRGTLIGLLPSACPSVGGRRPTGEVYFACLLYTSTWALEYERQHERIYCEQRLKEPEQREKAMPRNIWVAFQENQKEFERAEKILEDQNSILIRDTENLKNNNSADWKILKEIQRDERILFFNEGKSEFNQLRTDIYLSLIHI